MRFSIILFMLCFVRLIYGQSVVDSLVSELNNATSDSSRFHLYDDILGALYLNDMDMFSSYNEEAYILAKHAGDRFWIARFTYTRALALGTNNNEEAINEYLEAINLYRELNDSMRMVVAHNALISKYNDIGNPDKALYHSEQARSLISPGDVPNLASLNNRIGSVYSTNGDMATALRYFKLNIPLFDQLENNYGLGYTHQNVGIAMEELGMLDSALYHLELGLVYQRKSGRKQSLSSNITSLGEFYMNRGNLDQAEKYFLEAIELNKEAGADYFLSYLYENMTRVYGDRGERDKAIEYGLLTLNFARRGNDLNTEKDVLGLLAGLYEEQGDFHNALKYKKEEVLIKDSIQTQRSDNAMEKLEVQYQTAQKEAELQLKESQLGRQRTFIVAVAIIAVLLLVLSIVIWRSLEARKRINSELKELDDAKSRFFANISHELRTPLTLIIGPLENVFNRLKPNSPVKKEIQLALDNSSQLLSLVSEILDLSKLESGKLILTLNHVDLYKLVYRIFTAFESLAQIKKVHLNLDYQLHQNLGAELDIPKFEKILNNLVSNAIKFTPSDGAVTLKVYREQEKLIAFSVSDTGQGISSDQVQKIFDRYYQGSAKESGGTGIGLALSRELSTLHGGELKVNSKHGKGSTFTLLLPLKLSEISVAKESETMPPGLAKDEYQPVLMFDHMPKVLVIEDNESMRNYLGNLLSTHFQVSYAVDGEEGMSRLERASYDAITCDVMMPNMDGFEFLEKLRSREIKKHTPVIMLTARNLEEDRIKGFRLGTDDYITKPFNSRELVARLTNLIANKHSREEQENEEVIEIESSDDKMLKLAESLVLKSIADDQYGVNDLSSDMNYSSRQLSRILKKLTGMSTNQFIKEIRLRKAYHLISTKQYATISEVRYEVGISHGSYFTREFERRYGVKPSEVMASS